MSEEKKTGSHSVLIVEDDTFLLKVYLERLRDEGYEVAVATNGEEGLTMLDQERPKLILLDMILPRMSGFDFLKEMKKKGIDPKELPVIVLSNLGQDADIELAKELGAADYLVKANHSFRSVIDKINSYIGTPKQKELAASAVKQKNVAKKFWKKEDNENRSVSSPCRRCKKEIPSNAKFCPWCGAEM